MCVARTMTYMFHNGSTNRCVHARNVATSNLASKQTCSEHIANCVPNCSRIRRSFAKCNCSDKALIAP